MNIITEIDFYYQGRYLRITKEDMDPGLKSAGMTKGLESVRLKGQSNKKPTVFSGSGMMLKVIMFNAKNEIPAKNMRG